jgi:dihydroneopterin aldolase
LEKKAFTDLQKTNLYKIHLDNLIFHSFHGLYEEEKIIGNRFEVNASVLISDPLHFNHIDSTVNYESLFQLINVEMKNPTPLLETLADNIINNISLLDSRITEITISIHKLHPPIKGYSGKVGVTLSKKIK